ncbi:MAG: YodL domain-containing protein, partial [Oscillospiraceae bacterium]
MGRSDEQRDGTGGGDSNERADIRLSSQRTNETAAEENSPAVSVSEFISIASHSLYENSVIRNAHENSDNQEFILETEKEIGNCYTRLVTGEEKSEYSAAEIAPLYNRFQQDGEFRMQILSAVTEQLDNNLSSLEQTKQKAAELGIPFSDRPYNSDEEDNPYVYDGSMSIEDSRKGADAYNLNNLMNDYSDELKLAASSSSKEEFCGYYEKLVTKALRDYALNHNELWYKDMLDNLEYLKEVCNLVSVSLYNDILSEIQQQSPASLSPEQQYIADKIATFLGSAAPYSVVKAVYQKAFEYAYDIKMPIEQIPDTELEKIISEVNEGNKSIDIPADLDKFYVNHESEQVTWVYYNPDSSAGGQLVYTYMDFDDIFEAMVKDDPLEFLMENCKQTTIDRDMDGFDEALAEFMGDGENISSREQYYLDKLFALTEPRYAIFQLKDDEKLRDFLFADSDYLKKHGLYVDRENYNRVYRGRLKANETLDDIFERFNINQPQDFLGHSLSVGDIIAVKKNGAITANFVDSIGFTEVIDFTLSREERKARRTLTDNLTLIADKQLSSDEMDDLGNKLFNFENAPKYSGSSHSWIIGAGMTADEFESVTSRYHNGEDVRAELAKKIYDNMSQISFLEYPPTDGISFVDISTEKSDSGMTFRTKGGFEITHSWETLGEALITAARQEFDRHEQLEKLEQSSVEQSQATEQGIEQTHSEQLTFIEENAEEYKEDEEFALNVGDKIELDDGVFEITEISDNTDDTKYQLRDLGSNYPIFRVMYETELFENGFALVKESDERNIEPSAPMERSVPNIEDIPELKSDIRNAERHDFTITDENLGTGGAKSKFKANVAAIKLLSELELENRLATPQEQEVLSRYVGWGGLAAAFDENNSEWTNEFRELYSLLSPEEYENAKASTLTAYYTSPVVINAIYDGLANLGFKGGNVLEPAMGVGNFFGAMPEEMRSGKHYGVELDSISGRIAKQLYQNADIQVTGFEKTTFPDNFFDIAVGNVPFGQYKLSEKRYNKLNLNIHDHFFAKSLDKVRAGGVVAFVTSKGTLDKANPQFRKYLAQRAELIGAIRLPNNAFKENAGTEVTSDIIFLQKRDKMLDIEPDWVKLGETADGIPVNKYFEEHPEMILGEMKQGVEYSLYGNADSTACVPVLGASLKEQLRQAVANIKGSIPEVQADISEPDGKKQKVAESIPADPNVRNFSYAVVNDKLYFRENSRMFLQDLPKATEERIKGMCELRDCVRTLIDYQLNEYNDNDIQEQQSKLSRLYDDFSGKYGLINSPANERAFREDSSYHLLSSLEILNEDGNLERKADMFTKRTIKQRSEITAVDTSSEALAVSISEKAGVNMQYMEKLTGKTEEEIYNDLKGVIFINPLYGLGNESVPKYLTSDEYLSGNIREKLAVAQRSAELHPEDYAVNVDALTKAMPKPLEASEIDVRLGATWISTDIVKQFIMETLQTPRFLNRFINVNFSKYTSEWNVDGKNSDTNNVLANMTYGTARKNAYSIIEDTLNLRDARVYDRVEQPDGKVKSVLNQKETTLAQQKQEAIKQAFKDWIFKDPERREQLVNKYNELFNSSRPREYDGSHLSFSGISPEIQLREHQLNAIAHTMYGGNTLLAHQVGAGKTFEMVASAMESKRLGLCTKSLFVVPNHLTEQMGAEFLRLYPAANILVATQKDFEAKNRKNLCAKIATGDYDAVIIGHSQLEKIPLSQERQERMIRNQIEEIADGIAELKSQRGDRFSVKQLEKTKKNLEFKLTTLLESKKKDNVVTFEELGIDKIYIDEAHNFKNLFLYTKMRNVAGVQQTEAQKSSDLYMKCQYMDEITGGKGIVFATGTPISNSMTELYTMMRYLQADKLKEMGMQNFDAWAANFGESVTAIELAPEGTGYRAKTRFSKFFNLPELMNVFKEAADIKTADMLNLPVPEAHFHNVVVKPTEMQKEMISGLSERAKLIHNKGVAPEEDNMLKVTNDGRKIGLDQRLMNPLLPDDPNSKVNACINNVFDIYTKTSARHSTQLVFCDFSTPKNDGSFNLYDDIRDKLVARGVPKEEIAFIHEADTEAKKKELFSKVRQGKVRVLLGSTAKCGAGTNIQDKLVALHHLDCPWRPSDVEHTKRN